MWQEPLKSTTVRFFRTKRIKILEEMCGPVKYRFLRLAACGPVETHLLSNDYPEKGD